ncbi:hypothetical protein Tco_0279133, partial [Tanacetum coccineum]
MQINLKVLRSLMNISIKCVKRGPAEEQPMPAADSPTHQSPGYIPESDPEEDLEEDNEEDPEEDPADYPADRGDDDDDDDDTEEEEHLAPADPTTKDHAAVRAEIEVLRGERLAYTQESIETREALARSEAYCRALEAQVTVLETE